MCGICGIFDTKLSNRIDKNVLSRMVNKIRHRGPDGNSIYHSSNIGFGFQRLSIIDLNNGMQPILNETGSIILICNGEIFNYIELKNELINKGHRFKTNTDVEVILHLYEEYETGFINNLNGQFAFAIFDNKKNKLICARDHFGIAPLFYTMINGIFIFASEIKAILEHPFIERNINLIALDQLMSFPGIVSPYTIFKNINSLKPGYYLTVEQGEKINIFEYWDLIYPKQNEINYSEDENYYKEKLNELITKSVNYRLQADVPVGFYISGGLDSSIIASKIKNVTYGEKRNSFSIDFEQKEMSESNFQRMMSEYVGSKHHEKLFQVDDISSKLPDVIYYSESPLKETYNTASITLSKSVRNKNIKVILTGEGADELFGGYVGYKFDKLRQAQPRNNDDNTILECNIRNDLWGDENFFYEKDYYAFANIKKEIYSKTINDAYHYVNCYKSELINKDRITNIDILHKRSYIDFKIRMADHLLSDHGDRMAYANSVEARYPFLDKDLVEFTAQIPPDLKLKGFNEKYILKKVAHGLIPDEIINRQKFAFVAPGSPELLKQNNEYINDILSYNLIKKQGYFNPETIEKLKNKYSQKDFNLNLPFEDDYLIIAITFGILLEKFNIGNLI